MDSEPQIDLLTLPEYSAIPMDVRVKYFMNFALKKHRAHMDFILHTAKLRIRHNPETWAGWNNVMKHNVAQSATMGVLCRLLDIDSEIAEQLEAYAFIHNPTICRDKFKSKTARGKPVPEAEQFTQEDEEKLDMEFVALMQDIDPNGYFELATSPEFFDYIALQPGADIAEKSDAVSLADRLVYYVDALFDDGTLMPPHDRIALMEKRRPDLNEDADRTARLGMKYWDAERVVSLRIQEEIWTMLQEDGINLPSTADVPEFIRKQVAYDMVRHEVRSLWRRATGSVKKPE